MVSGTTRRGCVWHRRSPSFCSWFPVLAPADGPRREPPGGYLSASYLFHVTAYAGRSPDRPGDLRQSACKRRFLRQELPPICPHRDSIVQSQCHFLATVSYCIQVNLDMTDSMGPGKLVRHMQNPSYTYDKYLTCIGLGPSILSVICKNLSYSGPSYPSSPVFIFTL